MAIPLNLGNHYQTAGTQKYGGQGGIFARGYQTNQDLLTNYAYTDNSTIYPFTAVATGTYTVQNTKPPLQANQSTIFDPANTATQIPLVGESRNYATITAAAANDGINFPVSWDLTKDGTNGVAAIVIRSSSGSAISGKVKLRSSVGNESVYAFTTAANTNWATLTWNPQISGSGVTLTGTPVFSGITVVEITLNTLSTSVDVAMVYTCNHQKLCLGEVFTISFRNVDMADFKYGLESAVREAYQQQYAKTATGKKPEFTVETTLQNEFIQALFYGTMVRNGSYYKTTAINNNTIGQKKITNGTLTLQTGLKFPFAEVRFGDNEFLQPWKDATTIPAKGYYYYNSSTGAFTTYTDGTGAYEGLIPNIVIDDLVTGDYLINKGLRLGFYVRVDEKQIALDGLGEKNRLLPRCLMENVEFSSDNANDKCKFTLSVLPTGTDFTYFQQSKN